MIKTVFVLLILLASGLSHADEKDAALAEINITRQLVGLSAVSFDARLNKAAQSHADYLLANVNGISHNETPGLPGYTGATPAQRITAANYSWVTVNEVINEGTTSGQQAVRGLVQAIYHRFGILAPAVAEVGIGMASGNGKSPNTVVDFAATLNNAVTLSAGWMGTYPVDGQTGIPRDFYSDTEVPDPVAGQNRVAYPVSIHAAANDTLAVSSFTLAPVVGGVPLAAIVLAPQSDSHVPASAAALIALAPLEYGTRYRADFSGTRNGLPVAISWEFTTADYSTLTVDLPYQPVGTSQVARIRVSGGNGGSFQQNLSWQYSGLPPSPQITQIQPGLYEVSVVAPAEVTVTFADHDSQTLLAKVSFVDPISETTTLAANWNLVGNPLLVPIVATDRFGRVDAPVAGVTDKIISVWKWLPATSQWAFYAPSMTASALDAYTLSKGYAVLDQIQPGEGYWINTTGALKLSARTGVPSATVPLAVGTGWNLLAGGGEAMSPAAFDKALGSGVLSGQSLCYPNECWRISGGLAATPSITTLWTWDSSFGRWRFYAPSLALQGGNALSNYATGKGYLPYDLNETMHLHTGEGFWVNK